MTERLLGLVAGVNGPFLVLIAFCLAFGEAAFGLDLLVPGEAGMVVVGAAGDRAGARLWPLVVAGGVGAVAGDTASYVLGRRYGLHLAHRWRFTRRHVEPALLSARERFERHGGLAVAVARWIGALRAVVPVVAGAAGMPLQRFLLWNVPSALAWAAVTVAIGAALGATVVSTVDRAGAWLSAAVVAAAAVLLARRRRRRREDPSSADSRVARPAKEEQPWP